MVMNSNCRLLYIFFTSLDVIKTVLEPNWRGVDLRCAALRYVHSMELSFCKKADLIQRWWPFANWGRICLLFAFLLLCQLMYQFLIMTMWMGKMWPHFAPPSEVITMSLVFFSLHQVAFACCAVSRTISFTIKWINWFKWSFHTKSLCVAVQK